MKKQKSKEEPTKKQVRLNRIFRYRMCGNQMAPQWLDGDTIEFGVWSDPKELPLGEDVCVEVESGGRIFGRLTDADEIYLTLTSRNLAKHSVIRARVQLVGVARGYLARRDSEGRVSAIRTEAGAI